MVSPGPSVRLTKGRRRGKRKLHRPQDIREGVTNAYHIVKDVIICHLSRRNVRRKANGNRQMRLRMNSNVSIY